MYSLRSLFFGSLREMYWAVKYIILVLASSWQSFLFTLLSLKFFMASF